MLNITSAVASSAPAAQYELAQYEGGGGVGAAAGVGDIRTAVALVLASCAAVCADASVTLQHMPLWKACSGTRLAWRPCPRAFWDGLEATLGAAAQRLPPLVASDLAGSAVLVEGRAALVLLSACSMLLGATRELESTAAVALDVPVEEGGAGAGAGAAAKDAGAEAAAQVSVAPTPAPAPKKSFKEKIIGNGYAPPTLVVALMLTGVPIWVVLAKSLVSMWRGMRRCLRSAAARRELLADRNFQYACKFWLGLSLTVMGITLLLWLGEGSSGNAPMDAYNVTNFFFVWQPGASGEGHS